MDGLQAWPYLASSAVAQGSAGLCPGDRVGRQRKAQQELADSGWRLTPGPEFTYPVLLVHDLLLPLHQARCRASALLLCLGLEGSLSVRIVALTWDMREVNSSPSDPAAPTSCAAFTLGWDRGKGWTRWGGRARSRQLHTSLSIRSFFCCSRVVTSTSARARGSKQMSSAGTWSITGQQCVRSHREVTQKEWEPRRAAPAQLTFSSRAFTSHSWRCFRLRYGLLSKPSKLGSAAPEGGSEGGMGGRGTWN